MYLVPLSSISSVPGQDLTQQQKALGSSGGQSFASMIQEAMDTLAEAQAASQEDVYNLAMGDIGSLHNMMINSAMEATAVETAVQLTTRAVSAYKEIMQMQI